MPRRTEAICTKKSHHNRQTHQSFSNLNGIKLKKSISIILRTGLEHKKTAQGSDNSNKLCHGEEDEYSLLGDNDKALIADYFSSRNEIVGKGCETPVTGNTKERDATVL